MIWIRIKGNYDDEGKECGIWKAYFENGQVQMIGQYVKGFRNGEWKYYHNNGNITMEG